MAILVISKSYLDTEVFDLIADYFDKIEDVQQLPTDYLNNQIRFRVYKEELNLQFNDQVVLTAQLNKNLNKYEIIKCEKI